MTRARVRQLQARALLQGDPKARVNEVGARILYRRIPVKAAGAAEAAARGLADAGLSARNYGQASAFATSSARAAARVQSIELVPADPNAPTPRGQPYGVRRWVFVDTRTGEQTRVYINPNEMSAPPRTKTLNRVAPVRDGQSRMMSFETAQAPGEWSFGGVILHQAQHDMLRDWCRRATKIRIQDHLGRVFDVIFKEFSPEESAGRRPESWKMKYRVVTTFLRRVK